MRVDLVVFEGVEELDVFGPYEVLRLGAAMGADLQCSLVSNRHEGLIHAAHGARFAADAPFEPGAEVLVVPGGGWVSRRATGAFAEAERGELLTQLASSRSLGTRLVAGVCTGTMLLARAGLTRGRRATTHHSAQEELAALGAEVVGARVVDDGDLVTCGGVTSGIDLALWLLEREFSPVIAEKVATEIEYRPERPRRD
jgi:transcriptional regulator GlxA family with amidase domain